jgi:putative DNA primase/helicase
MVATESYFEGQDVIGEWLDDCCEIKGNAWASSTDLFDSWQNWAEERGHWIGSLVTFSQRLEDRGGFTKRKNTEQTQRGFAGLRLKPPSQGNGAATVEARHAVSGNGSGVDARS